MREVSAALMLYTGRNVVLSTLAWGFWEGGDMTKVAALGVVLTLALAILLGLAGLVTRRVQMLSPN